MPKRRSNGVEYVIKSDCKENMDKIELALWGADGRGGMVADIQEIKSATGMLKSVVVPIVIAALSALTTAGILDFLGRLHL